MSKSRVKTRGRVVSFVPKGRTEYCLYVVALREHEGVTKVGRTSRWKSRKFEYENWNLSAGDGLSKVVRFIITDEFVDLPALEAFVLEKLKVSFRLKFGFEWFVADFNDVVTSVRSLMESSGLSFDEM